MSYKAIKVRVFDIISKDDGNDLASRIFDLLIIALILLSVASIVLESFNSLATKYSAVFRAFEIFTVMVFTAEYFARIWTADLLYPEAAHPRLKYIFSFMALMDLLAILPFYLPVKTTDLRYLRMVRLFRLFRLFRVFKLGRYIDALQTIMQVVRLEASRLIMSLMLCAFVMLFSAIVMYTVENPVQPEKFPNVIASLWWAMCTLTTVGYGDVYPVTPTGRFFASVISLVCIGIIALPTGIIAAGFSSVISPEKEAEEEVKFCPHCGKRLK